MHYLVGLSAFINKKIFEPSLFVAIRKRLDRQFWYMVNEIIIAKAEDRNHNNLSNKSDDEDAKLPEDPLSVIEQEAENKNKRELLLALINICLLKSRSCINMTGF